MKLDQKLDKILESYNLQPTCVVIEPQLSQPIKELETNYFETLQEAIDAADQHQPDEDGIRTLLVEEVDLAKLSLPMVFGKFIVDDIQKRSDNKYEVHLVEH